MSRTAHNMSLSFIDNSTLFNLITVHHRTNNCPKTNTVHLKNARF